MKNKLFAGIVFFAIQFILFTDETFASFVKVGKDGNIIVKVLSSSSGEIELGDDTELEVKQVAGSGASENSDIYLSSTGGKVSLRIGSDEDFDVSELKEDLIELEERPKTKKVSISYIDDKFVIDQQGVKAQTNLPITIDPLDGEFNLKTGSGDKNLAVLPYEATKSLLRSRIVNRIGEEKLEIGEESGNLVYIIKGEKVIPLLDFYDFKFPITTRVSALTGEVMAIVEPEWLRFLSVFFS